MATEVRCFLDTSVLLAAVFSATGGARRILELGEAGLVHPYVGPRVLQEADAVLTRKLPEGKALFALLLDRAGVAVGPPAGEAARTRARSLITYAPDAHILAEAIECAAHYFVSLDRAHLVGQPEAHELPFPVGTPGDFLAWLRHRLIAEGAEQP